MARGALLTASGSVTAVHTGHVALRQSHAKRQSSQKRCSQAVWTGLSRTPWQMEQRRWRLMAAASTNSSASRPIVFLLVLPVGLCWPGCGATGLPGLRARDRMLDGGPEIDRTARDWAPDYERRYGTPRFQ